MPKLIMLIVGIGLLVAGLLAFVTSSKKIDPAKQTQTTSKPVKTSIAKSRSQQPLNTPSPSITWQKITQADVSMQLPTDWRAATTVQGDETLVAAFPTANKPDDLVPHVYIRKQNRKKTSAELEAVKLRSIGFQQVGTAQIAGVDAKEYNIFMPGDSFIKGNPQKRDVLQTIYLLEKNNAVYQVDLAYFKDISHQQTENLITQIASSISL